MATATTSRPAAMSVRASGCDERLAAQRLPGEEADEPEVAEPRDPHQRRPRCRAQPRRHSGRAASRRAAAVAAHGGRRNAATRRSPPTVLQPRIGMPGPPSATPTLCAPDDRHAVPRLAAAQLRAVGGVIKKATPIPTKLIRTPRRSAHAKAGSANRCRRSTMPRIRFAVQTQTTVIAHDGKDHRVERRADVEMARRPPDNLRRDQCHLDNESDGRDPCDDPHEPPMPFE